MSAPGTNPHENLALEALLLGSVLPGEVILYLWQNRRSVVIGRNQNCFEVCRVDALRNTGGTLARRMSGGGAVFHDLGNLNFTFLAQGDSYDLDRQLEVIRRACRQFGICAEKSGRNDLTVDGRKFSGNAFYQSGNRRYHHGTILLDTDVDEMSRLLRVSAAKLRSNGVQSVRSRTVNLVELVPEITVQALQRALLRAFEEVYEAEAEPIDAGRAAAPLYQPYVERFSSEQWCLGPATDFRYRAQSRFSWGEIDIRLQTAAGMVTGAAVYSDAMEVDIIRRIEACLPGRPLKGLAAAVKTVRADTEAERRMINDAESLLEMEWEDEYE